MKSKTEIRICLLIIVGIFFISSNSCSKNKEPPNEEQNVLPQKLIVKPDIYTDEMDDATGWTKNTGASMAVNTTDKYSGTGSIRITSNVGEAGSIEKALKWNLSADSGKSFRLWVYPHSAPVKTISSIRIYAHNDAWTNVFYLSFAVTAASLVQNEWTMIWLDPNVTGNGWLVAAGAPSWAAINKIRIVVGTIDGQVSDVSFDLLSAGFVRKPAVMIFFDDGDEGAYTKAYPLLKAKNMVATAAIISSAVNSAQRLTSANLIELNKNGWDIANHTKTHPIPFTSLTQAQQEAEINDCKSFLDSLGLTRASLHVVYPGGIEDATTLQAMAVVGAKTGRLAGGGRYSLYEQGTYYLGYPYKINVSGINAGTSLATAKGYINDALDFKAPISLVFHELYDSNPGTDGWLTSNFSDLLDYIESKGLQTLTIDEYYRLDSGPITVDHK